MGSEKEPATDTVIVEGHVCIVKEIHAGRDVAEVQPRVLPVAAASEMEVEAADSVCLTMERKVKAEMKAAEAVLKTVSEKEIVEGPTEMEQKHHGKATGETEWHGSSVVQYNLQHGPATINMVRLLQANYDANAWRDPAGSEGAVAAGANDRKEGVGRHCLKRHHNSVSQLDQKFELLGQIADDCH